MDSAGARSLPDSMYRRKVAARSDGEAVGMVGALIGEVSLGGPLLLIEQARLVPWVQVGKVGIATDGAVDEHDIPREVGGRVTGGAEFTETGVVDAGMEEVHQRGPRT